MGKETQSKLLANRLRADVFTFPDDNTAAGALVRAHLHHKWTCVLNPNEYGSSDSNVSREEHVKRERQEHQLDAMVFQALHTVSRLERRNAIIDSLKRRSVVLDRYWLSGMVYGSIDGLDEPWLRTINEDVMPKPDIWILLNVPLEESIRRAVERNPEKRDRYESNTEFISNVRKRYMEVFTRFAAECPICPECHNRIEPCAKCDSTGEWPQWRIVDGMGTKEEVHERIVNVIKERHAYYFCKDTQASHR